MRQLRPRHRATAWVTDHSREIADDKNCLVPQVLELPQFSQNDGVSKVNIGSGWIDT